MTGHVDLTVRRPTLGDAAGIAAVHIRAWQWAYRGQLPNAFLDGLDAALERRTAQWADWMAGAGPKHAIWVAVENEVIVGFVYGGVARDLDGDTGEVYAIYLLLEAAGKGTGRQLLARAEASLWESGFRRAVLWVLESNARARRFYEAAGWAPYGAGQDLTIGGATVREVRYAKERPEQY